MPIYRATEMLALESSISNIPSGFFSAHERKEYESFLENPAGPYFVIEDRVEIVACGGYAPHKVEIDAVGLCWGMVANNKRGIGLGRLLLFERLNRLSRETTAKFVIVNTSQHSRGFFTRMGFKIERKSTDGFCKGIDLYEMRLALSRTGKIATKTMFQDYGDVTSSVKKKRERVGFVVMGNKNLPVKEPTLYETAP